MAKIVPHSVASPNGTREDPYYWLRDDTRADPEVLAYLEGENQYAEKALAEVGELRETLYQEIIGRIQQEDSSAPLFDAGYWYYQRIESGADYYVHARRKGSMSAAEEILLDVPRLAEPHDFYGIGGYQVSPSGGFLAFSEDTVGRRKFTLRFKDLDRGTVLEDCIENVGSFAWAGDDTTIVYVEKHPTTLRTYLVKTHRIGDDPKNDRVVYEEKDDTFYVDVRKSKSKELLFIHSFSTLSSEVRFAAANSPSLQFEVFSPRARGHEYSIEHLGSSLIIRTNWEAKNFRIMKAPIAAKSEQSSWELLVPHREDVLVDGFDVFRDFLVTSERANGLRKLRIRPWDDPHAGDYVEADEPAYVMTLGANRDINAHTLRYRYSSPRTPNSTYELDTKTGERKLLKREPVLGEFDAGSYVVEYLAAPARDGETIPVTIVYHKDTKKDGTAPLYQYGYGSYGISMDPYFSATNLSLLDRGFVYAIAHIRGGQEKGRRWYEEGRQLKKKNTFYDFIDVTKYLVSEGYGAKDKVLASGTSAGGLLMGAVANMAPDLYRGMIASVPFVDIVTSMLDEDLPLTTGEFDEWGNPKEQTFYDYMLSYSPYDNVREQSYPAMLVLTGLWDSQVQYWEPAKWVAKLRAMKKGDNPLLFYTELSAGHGGRSGRFERYRDVARDFAFLLWVLEQDIVHAHTSSDD